MSTSVSDVPRSIFERESRTFFSDSPPPAAPAREAHGLVREGENPILVDVLLVLRHPLLELVEFLDEIVL